MIYSETKIVPKDNSNIRLVKCFHVNKKRKRPGTVGDIINVSVRSATPNSRYKKGDTSKAIITTVRRKAVRKDGSTICFGHNSVAILEKGEPVGTRITGPVDRELRRKAQGAADKAQGAADKILSIALEVH